MGQLVLHPSRSAARFSERPSTPDAGPAAQLTAGTLENGKARQRSTLAVSWSTYAPARKAGGNRPGRFRYPVAQVPAAIVNPVPYVEVLAQTKSQVTYNVGRCRACIEHPTGGYRQG
jgi:hypothetical protein